jgi:anthranilate synthase component 1
LNALVDRSDWVYLLESVSGPRKLAEFSFLGWGPVAKITASDGVVEIWDRGSGQVVLQEEANPLQILRDVVLGAKLVDMRFRFLGGAVGYISFESLRFWEDISFRGKPSTPFPDMQFGIYDRGVIFDHRMNEAYVFGTNPREIVEELVSACRDAPELESLRCGAVKPVVAREEFETMVLKAKEYIAAGEAIQVVLSRRVDLDVRGSYVGFYRSLREVNPSPYMYCLKHSDKWIVGSSPEMLVRVEGSRVETFPIAGTRPIKGDPVLDDKLKAELLSDEKELAEHVMLVDLARNDLGRICRFGTVRVESLMDVQRYSHVQHLVSHVSGEIRLGLDSIDVLEATFPAGTVSGAPKLRAIEIIDELEPVRRGPYAGCVGYISFNGGADFAITIRTLLGHSGSEASIQVGAGIVADSTPQGEWFETEHKAAAILTALER